MKGVVLAGGLGTRLGREFGLAHLNYTYQEGEGGIAAALALAEHFADGPTTHLPDAAGVRRAAGRGRASRVPI